MRSIKSLVIAFIMPLAIAMSGCAGRKAAQGPVPVTYIMVCCHSMDRGTKFLINGEWDSKHDYKDYETALGLMRQIKDAGINVIGIDFTNPPQWDGAKDEFFLMLDNVRRATKELSMDYFMFLGNTAAWTMSYWNEKARIVWETMVTDENYRRYGFGDDRPMLTIFLPGEDFKKQWDARERAFRGAEFRCRSQGMETYRTTGVEEACGVESRSQGICRHRYLR